VIYVAARDDRAPKILEVAARVRATGGRPFSIPIGASTPLGAVSFALAIAELADQMPPPDVIVHSTSSGGTQAGLVAGCRLLGLNTRVIGVSADEASGPLQAEVRAIVSGIADLLHHDPLRLSKGPAIEVNDHFVGGGYGLDTDASREAIEICARTEALFLDPTYTAKAMAAVVSYVRQQKFVAGQRILFWHTGGQVGLFR
jgi:L-cysteate sulfo-lyase